MIPARSTPVNALEIYWKITAFAHQWVMLEPADNAVVERFFGSSKHDWIFKIAQPTRDHMKSDVAAYTKYYNLERLHTANGGVSPINFETSQIKASGFA